MKLISIETDEFRQPIVNAIASGMKVVIWHQIPWSGGLQEWFLIHSPDDLDKIISKGSAASAFTAYEWSEVLYSRSIDQTWLEHTRTALEQETHNLMLLILPVTQEGIEPVQLTWVGDFDDIQRYYDEQVGSSVVVGRIPSIEAGEIARGYFPDENGNPRSGAY